ncbi:hypothetical protein [Tunturiibacter gelidoferens]|uniref:Uncharacterized protein n=2 Tax=Tunturiibacter gelidiferens TaxID=3069689 RepID=A0ACC5P031_9BACT|nr:hypothetical protein [Edaphobacter lichenicola]MBB5340044.1 hypothetical protein [Edaphobacter lichenicola]
MLVSDNDCTMSAARSKPLPDGFKSWIIASVSVLLFSLMLLLGDIVAAFAYFSEKTNPLWVTLLGVTGAFGVALGFAGLFVLLAFAGWRSYSESKRVQIIPPAR